MLYLTLRTKSPLSRPALRPVPFCYCSPGAGGMLKLLLTVCSKCWPVDRRSRFRYIILLLANILFVVPYLLAHLVSVKRLNQMFLVLRSNKGLGHHRAGVQQGDAEKSWALGPDRPDLAKYAQALTLDSNCRHGQAGFNPSKVVRTAFQRNLGLRYGLPKRQVSVCHAERCPGVHLLEGPDL